MSLARPLSGTVVPEAAAWADLAARTRRRRLLVDATLWTFLLLGSLPILVPYLWLLTVALSGRTGASTTVLWGTLAVLFPALLAWSLIRLALPEGRGQRRTEWALAAIALFGLAIVTGPHLHLDNWRFLWNPLIADSLKGASGVGTKFPSVWSAFFNSLLIASAQMVMVVTVATLAGYYLSRFAFGGREAYLQGLLVLHAFPAMTLVIPIFLLVYWAGLLDTRLSVILVIVALELPFAIFVMKGFFDAVPWEIEMSAMADGCSRRRAFLLVVLPQVKVGVLAVAVFAFLRGWEEYVFTRTLLIEKANWTMSLYLFWMREDVMGTDYAMVSAIGVFYVIPSIVLYTATQKYLTQMTIGGIKG
ncbi:MAG: carbohydrate ABC transporter permease [Geminicoccaceae bacterium]|nr:carbohydrate ABC transporter permease [Geminicoccaceae bacterium]MCX8101031.1 carbohydrate ABC transporter permease [Geminicoccaceae bacterium]MDW8370655.1 carbohydrate ABC transporter permease [Geminicoccaceae bacterium]